MSRPDMEVNALLHDDDERLTWAIDRYVRS